MLTDITCLLLYVPYFLYSSSLSTDYPVLIGKVSHSYDHANMHVSASFYTSISEHTLSVKASCPVKVKKY